MTVNQQFHCFDLSHSINHIDRMMGQLYLFLAFNQNVTRLVDETVGLNLACLGPYTLKSLKITIKNDL